MHQAATMFLNDVNERKNEDMLDPDHLQTTRLDDTLGGRLGNELGLFDLRLT
jgi:hypothetical protein